MAQHSAPMDLFARNALEIRPRTPSGPDYRQSSPQSGHEDPPEEGVTTDGAVHVQDEDNDILYDMACQCEELFDELRSAAIGERAFADICAEYQSRFAIWAAHIGVFARKTQCLDTRLRGYPELQDLCARLLNILQQSLQQCVDYYRQPTASESDQDMMLDVGDSQQPAGAQEQHLESLKAIEDTLARMNRLGVTIRQSSGAKAITRARKFAETLDLEYFTSLCSAAVQFLYPGAQQSLKAYMSHLMTDLYARIQHLESRRRTLETRRARTPRLPTIDEAPADVNATAGQRFQENAPTVLRHTVQPTFQRSVSQSDLSSVKLSYVLDRLTVPKQESATSHKTFSIQVNQASYPRPPASEGKSTRCEYCSELLSEEDLGGSAWRRHIDRDLKPYACLAEQCPEVDAFFPSFEAWFEHMQMHGRRWHQKNYQTTSWRCVICGDRQMYNNSQDLGSHMEKLHQDTFALSHIPAIARQSRVEHRAANDCLLCCFTIEPEEGKANQGASRPKRPRAPHTGEGAKSARSSRSMTSPGAKMIEPDPLDSESSSDSDEQHMPEISELSRTVARHIAAHLQVLMLVTLRLNSLQNGRDNDACDEIQSNYAELDGDYSVPASDDSRRPSDIVSSNDGTMERDDESAGDEERATALDDTITTDRVPSPDIELDFSDVRRNFAPQDDKFMKKMIDDGPFQKHSSLRIPSALSINDKCIRISTSDFDNPSWLPENLFPEFLDRDLVEKAIRTEECFKESEIQSLVGYSCRNPRVFLTLAVAELIEKLFLLCSNNIRDRDLPVRMESNIDKGFKLYSIANRKKSALEGFIKGKSSNGWRLPEVEQFVYKQWIFLAAVFHNHFFGYTFHRNQPLPYILLDDGAKTGHFSKVVKLGLQEDYFKSNEAPYPGMQKLLHDSGQKVFVVAVKKLTRPEYITKEEVNALFRAEKETLRTMRKIAHAHLIQAIASYEKGTECFFVFPWASGGNLRQLWMQSSPDSQDVFSWAWEQIRGLTEGLDKLHKEGTRHGDLKPENILIFKRDDDPRLGSLVIADVGSAKYHAFETSERQAREVRTDTRFFTGLYEPPENRLDEPQTISRTYDSWSLGCVLLEFIIWLRYGKGALKEFHNERRLATSNEDRFWSSNDGRGRILLPTASDRIQTLLHELQDQKLWAWRDLLNLVKTHLLVALLHKRKYIGDFWPQLEQIHTESMARNFDDIDMSTFPQYKTSNLVHKWETVENTGLAEELLERLFMASSAETRQSKENLPSHLCDDCAAIDFASQTYELHRSMQDLYKMSTRCALCNLLWRRLSGLQETPQEPLKLIRVGSKVKALPIDQTIISLYSDPGRQKGLPALSYAQLGLPLLPETASQEQFALLNALIRHCDEKHECMAPLGYSTLPETLPTRVIDVGGTAERIRLVETGEEPAARGHYIALSHYWGQLDQTQRFCTYADNIAGLKANIAYDELPRNFQDAIRVTRALGVRYLWIDSLCIIHGNQEDWAAEAVKIEDVFSNAYCTIAASSAASSVTGFLGPRRARDAIRIPTVSGAPLYLADDIDDFRKDVENSILSSRAWALQERVLSRRTIYFTSSQVYWECGNGVVCETLAQLRNSRSGFLGDSHFPKFGLQFYKDERILLVQHLYTIYSALALSLATDKALAVAGLERRIARAFNSESTYGVLWRWKERTLLWRAAEPGGLRRIEYHRSDSKVPSWSWMAYEGQITFVELPFAEVDWVNNVHGPPVENDIGIWADANDLGLRGAELMERAVLDLGATESDQDTWRCVLVGKKRARGERDDAVHYVLLIRPVSSASPGQLGDDFERIGVATLMSTHLSAQTTRVRVI